MKKSAIVYDKWLSSLGGGEVVACDIAKILADNGYSVTFVAGKIVDKDLIKNKLGIDLSKIELIEIWSDEAKIKQISKNKDLFINTSFLDYTYGNAKKNIYYTHFPKEPYNTIGEMLFVKFLAPIVTKFINPLEMMSDLELTSIVVNKENEHAKLLPAYILKNENRIAVSYLTKNKTHIIEFSIIIGSFTLSILKSLKIFFEEAKIVNQIFEIDHHHNRINFRYEIFPASNTAYLNLNILNGRTLTEEDKIFLLYPKTRVRSLYEPIFSAIYNKIYNKLRAGIFSDPLERLKSYKVILANSSFTQKWIRSYWYRESKLLYPPVDLLFHKYKISNIKKKKWICSVGRFFMLGHGKKQEILIKAFKKFYDLGYKDWELHLCGGVGTEESSTKFLEKLRSEINGYPIYFHLNVPRSEIEKVLLNSKIYWHATGFGENENISPIKFEHFGIAPIEAISAKCIPILFNGGGLRETIFESGFNNRNLYKSIDQLIENTIYFINSPDKIDWAMVFRNINSKFSLQAFKTSLLNMLNEDK